MNISNKISKIIFSAGTVILILALLSGCNIKNNLFGKDKSEVVSSEAVTSVEEVSSQPKEEVSSLVAASDVKISFLPGLSEDKSMRMSNCINCASYCYDNEGNFYGLAYDYGSPVFAKNPHKSNETVIIESSVSPKNVQFSETLKAVFYIDSLTNYIHMYRNGKVTKLPVMTNKYTVNGSDVFYLSNADNNLFRYNVDDGADVPIIGSGCDYIYSADNWIVFTDLEDGLKLKAFDFKNNYEFNICENSILCPIIDGNTLFYVSESSRKICKLDFGTGESKEFNLSTNEGFFLTSQYIYYYDSEDNNRLCSVNRRYIDPESYEKEKDETSVVQSEEITSQTESKVEETPSIYDTYYHINQSYIMFASDVHCLLDVCNDEGLLKVKRYISNTKDGEAYEFLNIHSF